MEKNIAVLSLSGGLDSTSLLLHLLNQEGIGKVYTVSYNYGQKHKIELECVKKNIEYLKSKGYEVEHKELDVSFLGSMLKSSLTSNDIQTPEGSYKEDSMKLTVVPNRNAIFSSIIFGYALSLAIEAKTKAYICLGIHAGDHDIYPDCRQEFRDALEKAFKLGNWDSELVNYLTPYVSIDKAEILRDAQKSCDNLKLDFFTIMSNTNTCYKPNEQGEACGKCGSCQERLLAFTKLNLIDPIEYVGDQANYELLVLNALESEKQD